MAEEKYVFSYRDPETGKIWCKKRGFQHDWKIPLPPPSEPERDYEGFAEELAQLTLKYSIAVWAAYAEEVQLVPVHKGESGRYTQDKGGRHLLWRGDEHGSIGHELSCPEE